MKHHRFASTECIHWEWKVWTLTVHEILTSVYFRYHHSIELIHPLGMRAMNKNVHESVVHRFFSPLNERHAVFLQVLKLWTKYCKSVTTHKGFIFTIIYKSNATQILYLVDYNDYTKNYYVSMDWSANSSTCEYIFTTCKMTE